MSSWKSVIFTRFHQVASLAGFLCIERLVRPLGKLTPLPYALWGMFGSLTVLLVVQAVLGRKASGKLFSAFEPAYRGLVKWGTCFFVPALMALPVAVAANMELFQSPLVVVKLMVLIVVGYLGSLLATGAMAGLLEDVFGSGGEKFTVAEVAKEAAALAEGKTGSKEAELLEKLINDTTALPDVIKELPPEVRSLVEDSSFLEGAEYRFVQLDVDETGALSSSELVPVVQALLEASGSGTELSARALKEQADKCMGFATISDGVMLKKDEFVTFAQLIAVESYLRGALTEDFCPVPDAEPTKKPRPYDPNWLKLYGAIMGGCVALQLAGHTALQPACEVAFMTCAVLGGFVIGQNLPAPVPQIVNPMITCIILSYACMAGWAALVGQGFMDVLVTFKGPQGAGGKILLPMLQPLLISLGMSLFERRKALRDNFPAMIGTTTFSAFFGLFFTALVGGPILRLPVLLAGSSVPRCVTSALALAIAGMLGPLIADAVFAVALVQVTGLVGASQGVSIMKRVGFTSPLQRGLAMGATACGLGTLALARNDPEAFGYSAVSFALCGSFATAIAAVGPLRTLLIKVLLLGR